MATAKKPVPSTPAAPTAHDHAKLLTFLQILSALAPAIAAPFIKNPNSQQIIATETGVASAILSALNQPK